MSPEAKKARNEYMRQWRAKNRERCNEYMRKWREANKDKVREYNKRYWEKKAREMNLIGAGSR